MSIKDWIRRWRWLGRRGEVIAQWSNEAQALFDLGQDLIPGSEQELSRDIYGLLIYAWGARRNRDAAFDAHDVLRHVRARAWRGYTDMSALLHEIRTALPPSRIRERIIAFFEELAEKRSTHVFLPVVSRIDRHQDRMGPPPPSTLRVDGLADRHVDRHYGQVIRSMFAGGPELVREQDVFLLAAMLLLWDEGPWTGDRTALFGVVRAGFLRLFEAPETVLAAVRMDLDPGSAHQVLAAEIVSAAEEIAGRAPWVWLEALYAIESAIAGPQWFKTAIEVTTIPFEDAG